MAGSSLDPSRLKVVTDCPDLVNQHQDADWILDFESSCAPHQAGYEIAPPLGCRKGDVQRLC